jgi:hypothetical protein
MSSVAGAYRLWQEYPADAGFVSRSHATNVLACCEWIRLLVGRSLALAQARETASGETRWFYLVLGVPAAELRGFDDREGLRLAQDAVRRDFAQLRRSIAELRDLLKARQAGASPEAFLRSFDLIIGLHLPTDPACWIVTDEGVNIVQWGVRRERERRLLEWTPEQLEEMQQHLLGQLGEFDASAQPSRPGSNAQIRQSMRERDRPRVRGMQWAWGVAGFFALLSLILLILLLRSKRELSRVRSADATAEIMPAEQSEKQPSPNATPSIKGGESSPRPSGGGAAPASMPGPGDASRPDHRMDLRIFGALGAAREDVPRDHHETRQLTHGSQGLHRSRNAS